MTKIFLPLLTVLFLFSGCVHPSATIVIAEHNQSADALILRAYPCMEKFYQQPPWLPKGFCDLDFFIVISNNGRESIGVGNEWNSWGYSTLEMEVMDSGGVSCSLIRKEGTWYRNFPEFIEIPPHSTLCWPISLDDGLWEACSPLDTARSNLVALAIGDLSPDGEIDNSLRLKCSIAGLRNLKTGRLLPKISSSWTSILFRQKRICPMWQESAFK